MSALTPMLANVRCGPPPALRARCGNGLPIARISPELASIVSIFAIDWKPGRDSRDPAVSEASDCGVILRDGRDSSRDFDMMRSVIVNRAAPKAIPTAREPRCVDRLLDRPFSRRCPNGRYRLRTILSSPRCGLRAWD